MLRLQTCDRLAGAFVVLFAMASLTACQSPSDMSQNDDMAAPVAKKVPFEMTDHGDTRVDNYFWMRLSDDQKKAQRRHSREARSFPSGKQNHKVKNDSVLTKMTTRRGPVI